jgi:hypothetical protein
VNHRSIDAEDGPPVRYRRVGEHGGWTRHEASGICSVAVDLKVSELVGVPTSWCRRCCRSASSGRSGRVCY